jgi:hypothetical protein
MARGAPVGKDHRRRRRGGAGTMTDFWADLATPVPATATPSPAAPPQRRRQAKATIPFPDAWLVFRAADDGSAEDVRAVAGSHLNRLRAAKWISRDWSHDIHLAAFAPGDQPIQDIAARDAWMGFLKLWRVPPEHLPEAMRQAAQIEGLEYLSGLADIYAEATKG